MTNVKRYIQKFFKAPESSPRWICDIRKIFSVRLLASEQFQHGSARNLNCSLVTY